MAFTDTIRNKMINKSLEKYEITIEQIISYNNEGLVNTGKGKGKKDVHVPYYEYYHFDSDEEYESWKMFCISTLTDAKVRNPSDTFKMFDMLWGLTQPYLFKDGNEKG
jgi:hypothetical protein